MDVSAPSLAPAIESISAYASAHTSALEPSHQETLREISRRLARMESQAHALIAINNRMFVKEGFDITFDPATDTMVVTIDGEEVSRLTLRRAHPDIPITVQELTSGGAYDAGNPPPAVEEGMNLRLALEEGLEQYYINGHKILKLFATIPGLTNIRCEPITRVRNNLVEHPAIGSLYSFGYGATGPRVKPMYKGAPPWRDEGLLPNTQAFVTAIVDGCRSGAP